MNQMELRLSEFVPQIVKDSSKANLSESETNLLGALCHTGSSSDSEWFSIGQKELFEMANMSPSQGKRLLNRLIDKKLIERLKGTNGNKTQYRLHPALADLLTNEPMDDEPMDDEPMDDEPMDDEPMDDEPMDDDKKKIDTSIPYDPRAVPQWESDALFNFIEDGTRDLKLNEVKGFQSKIDEYVLNFVDTMFYTAMKKVAKMRLDKIYERKLFGTFGI